MRVSIWIQWHFVRKQHRRLHWRRSRTLSKQWILCGRNQCNNMQLRRHRVRFFIHFFFCVHFSSPFIFVCFRYEGEFCQTDVDECFGGGPCLNGGTCNNTIGSFYCNCNTTGFNGELCSDNIDDCFDSPCQNGGVCADGINSFTCACAYGSNGTLCESTDARFGTSASSTSSSSDDGLTDEEIAGISIGTVVGIGGGAIGLYLLIKKYYSPASRGFSSI